MADEMRIGYLSTLYHTSIILKGSGKVDDYLNQEVSWRRFPNGPSMVEAFEKNDLDLGYLGLPPAMIGISRGLSISCVAGGHAEGTVLIGSRSFQGKGTIGDVLYHFRGRCIGTPRRRTMSSSGGS